MDSAAEDRASELEALESIYADDFRLVDCTGGGSDEAGEQLAAFEIDIRSREMPSGPGGAPELVSCCLRFEYTPDYPNSAPQFAVLDTQNLTDSDIDSIRDLMEASCQESLGSVMVFVLVSAVQDRLQDAAEHLDDTRRLAEERRLREVEEEEKKKFVGTPVTHDSFRAWRQRFDEEMAAAKARRLRDRGGDSGSASGANKKPTGKELFLADNRFDVSDLQILQEEGGDPVEVDESLFQSLDDLDLDQEEGQQ